MFDKKRIIHRLSRARVSLIELEKEHIKNKEVVNYYAGQRLGYLQGKIAMLEEILDEINETQ